MKYLVRMKIIFDSVLKKLMCEISSELDGYKVDHLRPDIFGEKVDNTDILKSLRFQYEVLDHLQRFIRKASFTDIKNLR